MPFFVSSVRNLLFANTNLSWDLISSHFKTQASLITIIAQQVMFEYTKYFRINLQSCDDEIQTLDIHTVLQWGSIPSIQTFWLHSDPAADELSFFYVFLPFMCFKQCFMKVLIFSPLST